MRCVNGLLLASRRRAHASNFSHGLVHRRQLLRLLEFCFCTLENTQSILDVLGLEVAVWAALPCCPHLPNHLLQLLVHVYIAELLLASSILADKQVLEGQVCHLLHSDMLFPGKRESIVLNAACL